MALPEGKSYVSIASFVDESTTTFDNGLVGFWVPSDITGTITVTADGKTGSTELSTKSDGPTCVTDLKLQ